MVRRRFPQQINAFASARRWLCSRTSVMSSPPQPPPPSPLRFGCHNSPFELASWSLFSLNLSASPSLSKNRIAAEMPFIMGRCCFSTEALADQSVGGTVDVPLAQTGEGIAECELLKWFVCEGDQVDEFEPLCEVQSDKATMKITSRYKGKVFQLLHVPGDIVKVGEALLKMHVDESEVPLPHADSMGSFDSLDSEECDVRSQASLPNKHHVGGVLSTPAVRNLAKEYGININDIQGSGKDGRVLKEDILNYAVNKRAAREPLASHFDDSTEKLLGREDNHKFASAVDGQFEDRIVPLRGFRRAMVKSMAMAAKIPHFYFVEEINCDALVELKASFQLDNSDPEVKHTFLPLLIKSLSMALSKYPLMNSRFNEESIEVVYRGSHNIGIAMTTSYGLVVPNVKNVQSLSILEITKELSRLQRLASDNKLSSEEISGGTITLSNIGSIGGKFGSPLLNVPEVSIIAIGRIQKVPQIADDGSVFPASVMSVNIGADHRVLDGATVARFCNEWKQFIENPERLLLHMR